MKMTHLIVDPARSQIGAAMDQFSTPWGAWDWLLGEYAPKAKLRSDDTLWIRFPCKFLPDDENGWWNERLDDLMEYLPQVPFKVRPYMLPPAKFTPKMNGQARRLHDTCRGGLAFDSCVLNVPPGLRDVTLEPGWDNGMVANHRFNSCMTEDEYRRNSYGPGFPSTLAPIKTHGRTLYMLCHRTVPKDKWNRAGIMSEMADFAAFTRGVNTKWAKTGANGVVPVYPLDWCADYGIGADEVAITPAG